MRITENSLRRIIRSILLENEAKHTSEEIVRGSDFVSKCIEWCNGQHFHPGYFFKDEVLQGFNCVHDLTFNTNYKNLKELYDNKLFTLKNILEENFESKREDNNFPDSYKFSRLLSNQSHKSSRNWIRPDYFYVRSFNQEDITRIKNEIKEGEQEYDVYIYDDPDLSNDDYDSIEKSRSSEEYQNAFKKFENENPHIFKDNSNLNFIVITSFKQKCNTAPIKGRPTFGSRGKHKLTPANESNWDFSIFIVCKKGDDLIDSIKSQLR